MTSIETSERQPSPQLQGLVANINRAFSSAKDLVERAYNLALEEGYTPQEAKRYLYQNITVVSERSIRQYLPAEVKDVTKQRTTQAQSAEVLPQNIEQDKKNIVEITTKHEVMDVDSESVIAQKEEQKEDVQDEGYVAELQYKLDQSNTARKELMIQLENLKKRVATIENVKSTGFIPSQEGDGIKTFHFKKIAITGLQMQLSQMRQKHSSTLFEVFMQVVDS